MDSGQHPGPHHHDGEYILPTTRIEGLSDAVFAIVMTLLVLEIHVPGVPESATRLEFLQALGNIWPVFFDYTISFIILGVYWIGHHKQFHYIQGSDRTMLWLNILFLMFISLIPFSTKLLGAYPERIMPVVIYSINMMLAAFLLYAKWNHATTGHRLVRKNLSYGIIQRGKLKVLTGILIYIITIFAALFSTKASIFLLILVPILYILPSPKEY